MPPADPSDLPITAPPVSDGLDRDPHGTWYDRVADAAAEDADRREADEARGRRWSDRQVTFAEVHTQQFLLGIGLAHVDPLPPEAA